MDQQEKEQQVAKLRQHRPWTQQDARFVLDVCGSSGETLEGFARRNEARAEAVAVVAEAG